MLQARIPAGHHLIELHYWPTLFTVGLVLAGACLVVLLVSLVIAGRRRSPHVDQTSIATWSRDRHRPRHG